MRTSPPIRQRLVALVAFAALATLAAPSVATPVPTSSSGHAAAAYLAGIQQPDGSVPGGFSGPVGDTIQAALALAATGAEQGAFELAADHVAANHTSYVFDDDDQPRPGALGYTAMLAVAAGDDPRSYGDAGTDLIAAIEQTEQQDGADTGLYGQADPYSAVFNHSLAMLGLVAADVTPSQAAIDWLEAQQCPDGGWPGYRSPEQRDAGTCEFVPGQGDPSSFPPPESTTPDSNSTALAVQALVAVDAAIDGIPVAPDTTYDAESALAYIATSQNADGGWAYQPGFDSDANSTGLIVQAITALGGDATSATWVDENRDDPFTALRSLQLGCEAPATDRGALFFPPFDPDPSDDEEPQPVADTGSTAAGAWGYAQQPFPFGQPTFAATEGFDCPDVVTDREAGDDRFDTAALLALDAYAGGSDTVVIASGLKHADALAGAPLARQLDAPILLVAPDVLPRVVAGAVDQLGATQAVVLGGTAAVSEAVVERLVAETGITADGVERIAGDNRFHTAALIAERVGGDDVYVVQGVDEDPSRGWADALTVSPLAAFQGRAILLTATDELPAETSAALDGKASATIVGGPAAVSEEVESAVDEQADVVSRVFGENRFGTALAVSRLAREAGVDAGDVWIATGGAFPDALAAGPIVAKRGALLFLVPDDLGASADAQAFVHEVNTMLRVLTVVGGTQAVSRDTVVQVLDAAR